MRKALSDWVSEREPSWRDGIEVAALDPFRGYATALRTQPAYDASTSSREALGESWDTGATYPTTRNAA